MVGGPAPAAHASPALQDARQRAAALRAEVDRLQLAVEQASEEYDADQEQLATAVTNYLTVERTLSEAATRSEDQQTRIDNRAAALYESQGQMGALAAALDANDLGAAMDGLQMVRSVMSQDNDQLGRDDATLATLTKLRNRLDGLAEQRVKLQAKAADKAQHIRDLLDRQQALLAGADARVKAIAAAEELARQRAAAAAAARALALARQQAAAAAAQAASAGVTIDASLTGGNAAPNAVAAAAVAWARTRLGAPYVWGATGPGTFDCSGLTGWAYSHAGLGLPRTAAEQWYVGAHISLAQLAPGDLLFWASDTSNPATIHHVAMYVGNNLMIAAPHTGTVVQIQPVYLDGFIGATRPSQAATS